MSVPREQQRALLLRVARRALTERGFEVDFPVAALAEVQGVSPPAGPYVAGVRDLRNLAWCSIDNDDSRDLDQLTVAEVLAGGGTRVLVAVADVSEAVTPGSALDRHAAVNTTSIYTPPQNFPMLPDRLSTDLTSLVRGEDRLAMVVDMTVDDEGAVRASSVYAAVVRNQAKLAYRSVGAWLENAGEIPAAIRAVPALADKLRLQDRVAQSLKARRHEHGAIELETVEVRTQFDGGAVSGQVAEKRNRAKELVEDFMIAANGAIARFLEARRFPVLRRVVRSPERWPRIVEIALALGEKLPAAPNVQALNDFLLKRRSADPLRFADLSLSIIKLLGRGEYMASFPGQGVTGHFGLAVSEYTHSTAPNRRYPDLITQRLVKAALGGHETPYAPEQLTTLAAHCTQKEDDAQKVERLLRKAAAACLLGDRIGDEFDGMITGASPKGTWVRVFDPPVEGRVEQGAEGLDVGDQVRVKLLRTDPERGFIDFACTG
jgi:exoribonuclease-2